MKSEKKVKKEKEEELLEQEAVLNQEEQEGQGDTPEAEVIDFPAQNAELLEKWQRTLAEFDNFRKRTLKEKASIYSDGVRDTLEKLLPTADNLERALAASEDRESSLYKGIEMTFRQLSEVLKNIGVEPLPGIGETFDPNLHNAVAHVEDENYGESVIVEELQKGYKYKDKILRPSMVKVAN